MIKKKGNKYYVMSQDGKDTLGGPYDSEKSAQKRLKEIEYFKKHPTSNNQYQTIVTNISGIVRNETMEGRKYVVAPMVMMVEGVLNGSSGPLLYPAEEIGKVPDAWNYRPLVINHPEDEEGQPLTAGTKEAIEQYKVGVVMNASFDGKRLKAEAWMEPERLKVVNKKVFDNIQKGIMTEVSTGLFTDNEDKEGTFNGKPYKAIARNYRPDHLAILPDAVGACSIKDGAGLLRVNREDPEGEKMFSRLSVNSDISFDDIRRKLYGILRTKNPGEMDCWIEDIFDEYFIYTKEGGKSFKQSYFIKDDEVQTIGEPTPVERKIIYEEISNSNQKGELKMNKETMVSNLIQNGMGWTEDDKPFLSGLSEDQLKKMGGEKAPTTNAVQEDPSKKETPAAVVNKTQEDPSKKETPAVTTNATPKPITMTEYLTNAPKEIRDVLQDSLMTQAKKKSELVGTIKANKKNIFTDDQLSAMNVQELEAIAALAKPEPEKILNYSGLGPVSAGVTANQGEDAPLEAPSMSFQEKK